MPEIQRERYEINCVPQCDFYYQGTYAGNAAMGFDYQWYPCVSLEEEIPPCKTLDEAEAIVIERFKQLLQRVAENPVASDELRTFAEDTLAA